MERQHTQVQTEEIYLYSKDLPSLKPSKEKLKGRIRVTEHVLPQSPQTS